MRVYDLAAERSYDTILRTWATDNHGRRVSLPFVFAPFVLPLLAAVSWLTYSRAGLAWYAINVGLLLIWPFLFRHRLKWTTKKLALALLLPPFFLPVTLALLQGQPSIVLLLLFTMSYLDLADHKDSRAGWWLALAAFKPQFLLPILLALAAWRKWRTVRAFFFSSAALLTISASLVGWHILLSYPRALMQFGKLACDAGGEHPDSMPNLRGAVWTLLHWHVSAAAVAQVTVAASLLLLGAMLALLSRRPGVSDAAFSLVILFSMVTSYHCYLHDDAVLLLPMILTAFESNPGLLLRTGTAVIVAGVLFVPLFGTELATTALRMFALIAAWLTLLEWQIFQGRSATGMSNEPAAAGGVAL